LFIFLLSVHILTPIPPPDSETRTVPLFLCSLFSSPVQMFFFDPAPSGCFSLIVRSTSPVKLRFLPKSLVSPFFIHPPRHPFAALVPFSDGPFFFVSLPRPPWDRDPLTADGAPTFFFSHTFRLPLSEVFPRIFFFCQTPLQVPVPLSTLRTLQNHLGGAVCFNYSVPPRPAPYPPVFTRFLFKVLSLHLLTPPFRALAFPLLTASYRGLFPHSFSSQPPSWGFSFFFFQCLFWKLLYVISFPWRVPASFVT